jgi:hypothetical protein
VLNYEFVGLSPGLDRYYYFFEQNLILTGKYRVYLLNVNRSATEQGGLLLQLPYGKTVK